MPINRTFPSIKTEMLKKGKKRKKKMEYLLRQKNLPSRFALFHQGRTMVIRALRTASFYIRGCQLTTVHDVLFPAW